MTRKELEQVYWLKKELRMWQERKLELELDVAPPVKQITGMPFANTNEVNSPTEEKAIKLTECTKVIDGKIAEIKLAIKTVEKYILGLDDPFMRYLIECRCVRLMKWEEIAQLLTATLQKR